MGSNSILIVEDEKIIAKGIEKRIRELGYNIAGLAGSSEEAIEKAIATKPSLILMDITLGSGIDGIETASRIKEFLDVPIVFLTAFSDPETLNRAKLTDPFGYVLKPFEDKDLQIAIEIALYKHQSEMRLRDNERWLIATLSNMGDAVIATDESGKIKLMNLTADRLTGWDQSDAVGKYLVEVLRLIDEKTFAEIPLFNFDALKNIHSTVSLKNVLMIARNCAEHPVEGNITPIPGVSGVGSGFVVMFRDITDRLIAEEHSRQAQKMEAIGRLAGGIAHDFNNIMTVINGYAEMLMWGSNNPERTKKAIIQISEAGKRASSLTQQILAFSRKQVLIPCVFDLNNVVRDVSRMVKRILGETIELSIDADKDLKLAYADPMQIGQVILNLAMNARDAIEGSGKILIATKNIDLDENFINMHGSIKPGPYVQLSVSDTGRGIPEEDIDRVFEPFFTTKSFGKGSGMGLATVQGIVTQSGGHIDLTSREGRGSIFRVYLPVAQVAQNEITESQSGTTKENDETILLVEDEDAVRQMVKILLTRKGYQVLEAIDGQSALRLGREYPDKIHLLLTDLMMPSITGQEVATELRKTREQLKVLYMSGYSDVDILGANDGNMNFDFIQKPFNLDAMTRKVRDILDRDSN